MTNKEKYKRAFSVLHASDDTMQEVLEMQNGNGKRYKAVHNTLRRGAVIAIAAALAALLGVTAYAVSTSDFFQSAFGSNISTEPAEIYSNSGEKIDLPEAERVEVDDETAQALVGDYVIPVGQSFSSPYALTGRLFSPLTASSWMKTAPA